MSSSPEVKHQLRILSEGIIDLISEQELEAQIALSLKEKRPLRVKYGADPSSPDLHLGHTVPIRKLRQFQELGHKVVFIIGDFTAMVGDPSQKSQTRPMLSADEVKANAQTYQQQVFKLLDPSKTEVRYNSEWLGKMTPQEFLHLTAQYTVARLLERDDFKKRYESKQPLALIEFLYPLLQGYDSVKIHSDIELGGSDQKFNLLVGRELQKIWQMKPQIVMTLPLIEGTDGTHKMSKSLNNHIAIKDSPREMFGKVMSLPDILIGRYYQYVSGLSSEMYAPIIENLKNGNLHPREAKAQLGEMIVSFFHSVEDGKNARGEFDRIFKEKGLPDDIPTISFASKTADIVSLLKDSGLCASKGEARRMIEQGGVRINQTKVSDETFEVDLSQPQIIQFGKRKFAKVVYVAN